MEISKILEVCQGKLINEYNPKYKKIRNIKIDSREVKKRNLFIALIGEKFDGHDFIEDVINNGANAIIVEKDVEIETDIPIIKVSDTYQALINIAAYKRTLYDIPVIAVTGSTGKTTTKDLIWAILSTKYKVLKSQGNNNNHIGIPKTLFKLSNKHEMIVIELGMNHLGEISKLSKLCQPNVAVITNVGTAHIGNLGSKRKILSAKAEVLDGMTEGKLIINGDDKYLRAIRSNENITIVTSGKNKNNNLVAYDIKSYFKKTIFKIKLNDKEYKITYNVPGAHLINNVLLAIQAGLIYKVPIESIINAIESYRIGGQRMNIKSLRKNSVLIDDSYNSSYESLVGALELIKNKSLNKVIILGDILELGKYSKRIHRKIGRYLETIHNKTVLLVGDEMKKVKKNNLHFNNNQELIKHLKIMDLSNSIILVKGSRAMGLEEVTEYIKTKL